jgi:two-component system, NtrC family, response regulator HydG
MRRLITATNKDPKRLLSSGGFRDDFYYRIRVYEINMPPLRERKQDIPILTDYFIKGLCASQKKQVKGVSEDVLDYLRNYPWPGNIRELKNAIEHAFVTVDGDTITVDDIPFEIQFPPAPPPAQKGQVPATTVQDHTERERISDALKRFQGNQTEAAKSLNISRVTLWKKMKRSGIDAHAYSKC